MGPRPYWKESDSMIYVGIDVAKDKHDCITMCSDGEIIKNSFTIKNNLEGRNSLIQSIPDVPKTEIRVGLEAKGDYNLNLMNFIIKQQLPLIVSIRFKPSFSKKLTRLEKVKRTRSMQDSLCSCYSQVTSNLNQIYHII